jgi:formylmethanofuran dehydrogenase subunit E
MEGVYMKTKNDYLAEYVRENRPEIEESLAFMFWKATARVRDSLSSLSESIKMVGMKMRDVLDNLDAYDAYEKEQEKELASRPKCAWCGEPIQEECAYRINGEWVCEHCIDDVREYID